MIEKIESSLFSALQKGDEEEIKTVYESIYNQYYKLVYFCVAKYIYDDETIKDLVNESFLIFFENISKVKKSIKYYLLTIAKNVSKSYLFKFNDIDIVDGSVLLDVPDNSYHSNEIYTNLIEDLKTVLSNQEVDIIISHVVDGMTFKELEKKFNLKARHLNKIYERAIIKFKKNGRSHIYER